MIKICRRHPALKPGSVRLGHHHDSMFFARCHEDAVAAPSSDEEDGAIGLAPELLSFLLEMRAESAAMHERILARLDRLDQRVARMERSPANAPVLSAVHSCGRSGETSTGRVIIVQPRQLRLDDLSPDLLALVAAALPRDNELAAALTCRKLRAASARARLSDGRSGTRTAAASACSSHARLVWSVSCGLPLSEELCAIAAGRGQLLQLSWLRSRGCPWDEGTCTGAALRGDLALLQWARANGCPWSECTCAVAARDGHLALLQWARANGCPWDVDTCKCAAYCGHLAVGARQRLPVGCGTRASAARAG